MCRYSFAPTPSPWLLCLCCTGLLCAPGCQPQNQQTLPASATVTTTIVNAIRVQPAENSSQTVVYYGKLEPVRTSHMRFAKPGTIQTLAPLGSRAAEGEPLASLNQQALAERQQELQDLLQALPDTGANQQRINAYQQQLRELEQQLQQGVIKAPWDCLVAAHYLDEGSSASPQSPVLRIVAALPPRVVISLPRRIADRLQVEQPLWVVFGAQLVECRVAYRAIEEMPAGSKTVRLAVQSDLTEIPWAFGQTVEVRFQLATDQAGTWVPMSALHRDASGLWSVYLASAAPESLPAEQTDENTPATHSITSQLVQLLHWQNDWALVDGGLAADQLVVVNGTHRIVSGQSVQVHDVTGEFTPPDKPRGDE